MTKRGMKKGGMKKRKPTPSDVATEIRRILKGEGSVEHAAGVQWFFKEEIKSHGWYTADLRKLAVRCRMTILNELGLDFLIQVADQLFRGRVLEEKIFAVFLLEKLTGDLDDDDFAMLESWLARLSSWADHDGLVHYLIAPMVAAKSARVASVFAWAKSPDRWHRRAACVAQIQGTRQKKFFVQITRLSNLLLSDQDDMEGSAGCCAKRRRPIQRGPFRI
jgi:3-methyladenine DNA glycosylase AlkD